MQQLDDGIQSALGALCAQFKGPIGVAVSGGGDSLALLYMAAGWAEQAGRSLLALTVDHGLRPEAALEAETVGRHCAALEIPHQILKWSPPEGHVGQARSRRARHTLLAEALRESGGSLLLMGHTRDDQDETIAMRAARVEKGEAASERGGSEGLAGMRALAVSPVWPEGRGIFIGRPCLSMARSDLRAVLRLRGIGWSEDPSNQDRKYERVRAREALCAQPGEGLEASLLDLARQAEANRVAQDKRLVGWLRDQVNVASDGTIRFDPETLSDSGIDTETLAAGLAWLLMAVAGSDRRARLQGRLALARDILNMPHTFRARTLGGGWIAPRQKRVTLARDPGRLTGQPGGIRKGMIWDGRFQLHARDQTASALNLEPNLHICPEISAVSAMARESCPVLEGGNLEAICLLPDRLKHVVFMLSYDNLMY